MSRAALEDLERAYGRLIAALESEPQAGSATLAADWNACLQAFERARASAPETGSEGQDERAARLRVQRMHAVVSSLAVRSREAVASEIARVAGVRARLPARGATGTGRTCDVSA